ncbi:unnamed protein product [Caenorhabditis angaria]|uniref:Uncharacterized protein n=1 Tax=Caenorhabditis angaria TaxID=860376 RepID=A0A9P1IUE2_9PELO|nr:unnamed protein product [Caenorhabditis angaria]
MTTSNSEEFITLQLENIIVLVLVRTFINLFFMGNQPNPKKMLLILLVVLLVVGCICFQIEAIVKAQLILFLSWTFWKLCIPN